MQPVERIVYEGEDMKETGRVKIQILLSERIVYEWENMEEVGRER